MDTRFISILFFTTTREVLSNHDSNYGVNVLPDILLLSDSDCGVLELDRAQTTLHWNGTEIKDCIIRLVTGPLFDKEVCIQMTSIITDNSTNVKFMTSSYVYKIWDSHSDFLSSECISTPTDLFLVLDTDQSDTDSFTMKIYTNIKEIDYRRKKVSGIAGKAVKAVGMIIGIVVGLVVLILICGVVVCCLCCRGRRSASGGQMPEQEIVH